MENFNSKIQSILADLYKIEPQFKQNQPQIKKIVEELLLAKPEIQIDQAFVNQLREELAAKTKIEDKFVFNKLSLTNFKFMKKLDFAFLGVAAVLLIVGAFFVGQKQEKDKLITYNQQNGNNITSNNPAAQTQIGSQEQQKVISQVKKFASKEEFIAYLSNSQSIGYGRGGGVGGGPETMLTAPVGMGEAGQKSVSSAPAAAPNAATDAGTSDRVSETNVQVLGIDEPDIVKTDGKSIYLSSNNPYVYYSLPQSDIMPNEKIGIMPPYQQPQQETDVVSAVPVKDMKKIAKIDKQGDMLLYNNTLIVFTYDYIYGYNVQDPQNPKQAWKIKYENNSSLVTARLYNGKLYLVTRNYPDYSNPCPITPLVINDKNIVIPCTDIYHPIVPITDSTTYSAFVVDPGTGDMKNKLSFVGSSGDAVVYMSQSSLYITYTYSEDQVKVLADFIKTKASDIFPQDFITRLNKLLSYDISSNAKMTEFSQMVERYMGSLNNDDRVKTESQLTNRLNDYLKAHKRNLIFSGIVKIPLDKFEIAATGNVPGTPLNQFSLDEYQGNLRIAVTAGNNYLGYWGSWNGQDTVNDVYVLDASLKTTGSVQDLGKGERIYSARFIDDKGYLVTFKQTDPFYVLDLSNPKNPVMKGELKIPGFSSYLHPLKSNLIVGIWQESSKVKVSLFDVSDPSNPKELDKYLLDEYWTDVSSTHHAFLQDKDHEIFFLPGGNNGYIFTYKNNKLDMQKAVSQIQARRALYIGDNLYVIGTDKIVVVDENTWERVNEIAL